MQTKNRKYIDPCMRSRWLLIDSDEGMATGKRENGRKKFQIVAGIKEMEGMWIQRDLPKIERSGEQL